MWVSGFWDVPLSGMCLIEEELCWFYTPAGTGHEHPWNVRRLVARLPAEVKAQLVEKHMLFETFVGTHWCYHFNQGRRTPGVVRPQEQHKLFYSSKSVVEFDNKHTTFEDDLIPFGRYIIEPISIVPPPDMNDKDNNEE